MVQEKKSVDFCLLIPCFNNEEGLIRSLRSVRYHSNRFLILVVDDGSNTPLESSNWRSQLDTHLPVRLLSSKANQGITAALNLGLRWIYDHLDTKYIARLDCGDICHPDRFNEQVGWMDEHPDHLLLGSWCRFQYASGKGYDYKTATEYHMIMRGMHFRNLFIHPCMLFRKTVFNGAELRYPENYPHAEDFALAWMLLKRGKAAILPRILVYCELTDNGLSNKNRGKQIISRKNVIKDNAVNNILIYAGIFYHNLLGIVPKRLVFRLKHLKF